MGTFAGYRTPQKLRRVRPRLGSLLLVCPPDLPLPTSSSPPALLCTCPFSCPPDPANSCFDVFGPFLRWENHPSRLGDPPSRSPPPPPPPALLALLLLLETLPSRGGLSDSVAPDLLLGVLGLGEEADADTGELEQPVASVAQEGEGRLGGNLVDRGRRRDSGDHRCCWCRPVGDWVRGENPLLFCRSAWA